MRETLAKEIIVELLATQARDFERIENHPLPAMIWTGDGGSYKASQKAFDLIDQLAGARFEKETEIANRHTFSDVREIIGKAFAQIISETKLSALQSISRCDIYELLQAKLDDLFEKSERASTFVFGCDVTP